MHSGTSDGDGTKDRLTLPGDGGETPGGENPSTESASDAVYPSGLQARQVLTRFSSAFARVRSGMASVAGNGGKDREVMDKWLLGYYKYADAVVLSPQIESLFTNGGVTALSLESVVDDLAYIVFSVPKGEIREDCAELVAQMVVASPQFQREGLSRGPGASLFLSAIMSDLCSIVVALGIGKAGAWYISKDDTGRQHASLAVDGLDDGLDVLLQNFSRGSPALSADSLMRRTLGALVYLDDAASLAFASGLSPYFAVVFIKSLSRVVESISLPCLSFEESEGWSGRTLYRVLRTACISSLCLAPYTQSLQYSGSKPNVDEWHCDYLACDLDLPVLPVGGCTILRPGDRLCVVNIGFRALTCVLYDEISGFAVVAKMREDQDPYYCLVEALSLLRRTAFKESAKVRSLVAKFQDRSRHPKSGGSAEVGVGSHDASAGQHQGSDGNGEAAAAADAAAGNQSESSFDNTFPRVQLHILGLHYFSRGSEAALQETRDKVKEWSRSLRAGSDDHPSCFQRCDRDANAVETYPNLVKIFGYYSIALERMCGLRHFCDLNHVANKGGFYGHAGSMFTEGDEGKIVAHIPTTALSRDKCFYVGCTEGRIDIHKIIFTQLSPLVRRGLNSGVYTGLSSFFTQGTLPLSPTMEALAWTVIEESLQFIDAPGPCGAGLVRFCVGDAEAGRPCLLLSRAMVIYILDGCFNTPLSAMLKNFRDDCRESGGSIDYPVFAGFGCVRGLALVLCALEYAKAQEQDLKPRVMQFLQAFDKDQSYKLNPAFPDAPKPIWRKTFVHEFSRLPLYVGEKRSGHNEPLLKVIDQMTADLQNRGGGLDAYEKMSRTLRTFEFKIPLVGDELQNECVVRRWAADGLQSKKLRATADVGLVDVLALHMRQICESTDRLVKMPREELRGGQSFLCRSRNFPVYTIRHLLAADGNHDLLQEKLGMDANQLLQIIKQKLLDGHEGDGDADVSLPSRLLLDQAHSLLFTQLSHFELDEKCKGQRTEGDTLEIQEASIAFQFVLVCAAQILSRPKLPDDDEEDDDEEEEDKVRELLGFFQNAVSALVGSQNYFIAAGGTLLFRLFGNIFDHRRCNWTSLMFMQHFSRNFATLASLSAPGDLDCHLSGSSFYSDLDDRFRFAHYKAEDDSDKIIQLAVGQRVLIGPGEAVRCINFCAGHVILILSDSQGNAAVAMQCSTAHDIKAVLEGGLTLLKRELLKANYGVNSMEELRGLQVLCRDIDNKRRFCITRSLHPQLIDRLMKLRSSSPFESCEELFEGVTFNLSVFGLPLLNGGEQFEKQLLKMRLVMQIPPDSEDTLHGLESIVVDEGFSQEGVACFNRGAGESHGLPVMAPAEYAIETQKQFFSTTAMAAVVKFLRVHSDVVMDQALVSKSGTHVDDEQELVRGLTPLSPGHYLGARGFIACLDAGLKRLVVRHCVPSAANSIVEPIASDLKESIDAVMLFDYIRLLEHLLEAEDTLPPGMHDVMRQGGLGRGCTVVVTRKVATFLADVVFGATLTQVRATLRARFKFAMDSDAYGEPSTFLAAVCVQVAAFYIQAETESLEFCYKAVENSRIAPQIKAPLLGKKEADGLIPKASLLRKHLYGVPVHLSVDGEVDLSIFRSFILPLVMLLEGRMISVADFLTRLARFAVCHNDKGGASIDGAGGAAIASPSQPASTVVVKGERPYLSVALGVSGGYSYSDEGAAFTGHSCGV